MGEGIGQQQRGEREERERDDGRWIMWEEGKGEKGCERKELIGGWGDIREDQKKERKGKKRNRSWVGRPRELPRGSRLVGSDGWKGD